MFKEFQYEQDALIDVYFRTRFQNLFKYFQALPVLIKDILGVFQRFFCLI